MNTRWKSLPLMFLAAIALLSCRPVGPAEADAEVATSFYPLYEAARQVGGDRLSVRNMVPPGTEPHEFDPTPKDVARMLKAKIVVYNGAGFEPWLERLLPDLRKRGVILVDASKGIELMEMTDEDGPSRRAPDPHFWLDPVLMQRIVNAVKEAYVGVDPQNGATYEANAAAYLGKLSALHQRYQAELQRYPKRTIVTSHAAFAYLARRYGLEVINIAGLSPIQEPSPQQMAAVVRVARERGVKYIFFETLVSPALADTIAREVGAGTLVFNPLEGLTDEELREGKDYVSVMEENLVNLKTALEASR